MHMMAIKTRSVINKSYTKFLTDNNQIDKQLVVPAWRYCVE